MSRPPTYPGAPRWVKILGIVSLALAAVFVVVHLAGGGFHHHSHVDVSGATTQKAGQ